MKSLLQATLRKTMTFAITFPLLIWSGHASSAANAICPALCKCENYIEEGFVIATCSQAYLSIVPPVPDWPWNVTHMDLSSNKITTLDTELAHNTVQVLDLSDNQISTVVQNAFGGLKQLKYLNLANNVIKSFEENGFYGIEHLQSLNISGNNLKTLPENIFINFIGLQELSMANNPFVHLDPNYFNRLVGLRWLDLSNTDLYNFPPHIFHPTVNLEFLDLSANDFHEVPTDALRSAKSLKHLKLNENPVDVLDKKSFIKLESLEVLELNEMDHLEKVMAETFSPLTSLRILEMKYNRYLTSIDATAFLGLFNDSRPTLQELDLEGNQLTRMDRDTVACAKMRKFNVQRNPWYCDCNLEWIKHCEIQQIYEADLKCSSPLDVQDAFIFNMMKVDFVCDYSLSAASSATLHHEKVIRSISVAVCIAFLVALALGIALVLKWRNIKSWYRYKTRGPGAVYYVRARNSPGPGLNNKA